MEVTEATQEISAPTKRKIPLAFVLLSLAIIIGILGSVFVIANDTASKYRVTLKSELGSLRASTDAIEKQKQSESETFADMKTLLANYQEKELHIKAVMLGPVVSGKYQQTRDLDKRYDTLLDDYQNIVGEYFTKVVPAKAGKTKEQKEYLADYAKRLETIKEQRRQLEDALKS